MTNIRTLIFIGCLTLMVGLFPGRADSFGLDDIGLNKDSLADAQCTGQKIQDALDMLSGSLEDKALAEIKNQFSAKSLLPLVSQLIQCYISDLQILATGSGTSSPGNASCARSIGGKLEAQIKTQYEDQFRQKFLDDCQGQLNLDLMNQDYRNILNQNGRDGGPVWVQSWDEFVTQSRYRGVQLARNQMANTQYCPWVQGDMQGIFNFSPADAVDLVGQRADGIESYVSSAACSLPKGFDPYSLGIDPAAGLAALLLPQNNIVGAYLLAQDNITRQVNDTQQADQFEYVNTGGMGALRQQNPQTGDSCLTRTKDGSACLQYSSINYPASGVLANFQALAQANADKNAAANAATTDARTKMALSFLDLTQPPQSFEYGFSLGLNDMATPRTPTPSIPTPTPAPGSVPAACDNLPADCTCVANDPGSQALASSVVLAAENAAMTAHPEMLNPDGVSLKVGQNIPFLDAVCVAPGIPANTCRPRAGSETDIIVNVGGMDFAVNILTPTGFIRRPGQVIAACVAEIL